jgi:photosystem II stability/assembly factor-like uncharacterized protein
MIPSLQDTVYALAAAGDTLYAGRASGLYRSDDDGASWRNTFASLERSDPLAVTALAVADSTVFAGVNGAVLRSDDSGDHWQIVTLASPAPQVVALALSPDGTVIAGTAQDGVFVSTDRGASWIAWNFGLIDLNVYALALSPDFERDHIIFAGTVSGIFESRNGGRSWKETSFPMNAAPVLSLAVSPANLIYAGTEAHGLFVSDDGGSSWRQVGEFASSGINAVQVADGQAWLLAGQQVASGAEGRWQAHGFMPDGRLGIALLRRPHAVIVGCADGALLHLR